AAFHFPTLSKIRDYSIPVQWANSVGYDGPVFKRQRSSMLILSSNRLNGISFATADESLSILAFIHHLF
ncbi:MAG: hypothetical protein JRM87_04445, partial [Nitrososphaerota archaeon]|nr:hypothetical protein [Nitrososphaerota archaeon]